MAADLGKIFCTNLKNYFLSKFLTSEFWMVELQLEKQMVISDMKIIFFTVFLLLNTMCSCYGPISVQQNTTTFMNVCSIEILKQDKKHFCVEK